MDPILVDPAVESSLQHADAQVVKNNNDMESSEGGSCRLMSVSDLESLEVNFVVPSFKSRKTIGATLESILSQKTDASFEVIVVDSSPDSTRQWIESHYPSVRVISSESRLSPGRARNLGSRHGRGRYLAFVDADASAHPDWLHLLLTKMRSNPDIKAISGAVRIGNPGSIWARLLHWVEFSEFIPGSPSGFREHLSSSNLLINREDFWEAGGFDERFEMAEDLLLSRAFPDRFFFEGATSVTHCYRTQWAEIANHLGQLGRWSGRLRGSTETKGSWLRNIPIASFALPPARTILILWRVLRADTRAGLQALMHAPLILGVLFHWALGFYRGLKEGSPQ